MNLRKDSPIAVLGAGISGLTFATEMKERGFTRVVVFERAARVGGKSCTVSIGGHPHDLGATMGVPLDYRRVLRFSARAGIRHVRFPRERHWSLERGGPTKLNRLSEIPGILAEVAKYVVLHGLRWHGADGTGLHRAPPALRLPWSQLIDRHRLHAVNQRMLAYRTGYGYGYDDSVPAIMYANLFRPQTILGLAFSHSFMWEGGTQPIWDAVARDLDVHTSVTVERVERDAAGVVLHTKEGSTRFERVVITLSPLDALKVLDATAEEQAMFSAIRMYPYATFACEVDGLSAGESSVGYIDENMVVGREGHPMAWVKRYPDQNLFVFHLFAPTDLADDAIAARIAEDVGRLGGRFVKVHAARRWDFFPHFTSEFMAGGGLERVERWQGSTNAYLIGEAFSFASMARVAELASGLAARFERDA